MRHKNKTFATFLAAFTGALGLHRFYLHGKKDIWAWLHLASLPLSGIFIRIWFGQPLLFTAAPLVLSFLIALIEALTIGLTPDDRWDQKHNSGSGKTSDTGWPIAVLLVLITGTGAIALIAVLSRTMDLLFTGGAYG